MVIYQHLNDKGNEQTMTRFITTKSDDKKSGKTSVT